MSSTDQNNYKNGHQVKLLRSGDDFFAAVERAIDKSCEYIHFQTYILDEDATGRRIVDALIRAAERGVRVYLLLDAYGTKYLTPCFIKSMENAGIHLRFFSPFIIAKGFRLMLRQHSKIVLVDGDTAIIGGLNIADRYHGTADKPAWLDFAVEMRGPECVYVLDIVKKLWNRTLLQNDKRSKETIEEVKSYTDNIKVKVLQNNWYRRKFEILHSYRGVLKNANDRIIIFGSYFLPGRNERKLLRNASQRGVDVSIVVAAESDVKLYDRATQYLYDLFLRNNIRIYEYKPTNLHAKVATVDGKWSTIGSYNINHLGDFAAVEVNVGILDEAFSLSFEEILKNIISSDCHRVTIEENQHRKNLVNRAVGWLSFQTIRLMMRVLYKLITKKDKKKTRKSVAKK